MLKKHSFQNLFKHILINKDTIIFIRYKKFIFFNYKLKINSYGRIKK